MKKILLIILFVVITVAYATPPSVPPKKLIDAGIIFNSKEDVRDYFLNNIEKIKLSVSNEYLKIKQYFPEYIIIESKVISFSSADGTEYQTNYIVYLPVIKESRDYIKSYEIKDGKVFVLFERCSEKGRVPSYTIVNGAEVREPGGICGKDTIIDKQQADNLIFLVSSYGIIFDSGGKFLVPNSDISLIMLSSILLVVILVMARIYFFVKKKKSREKKQTS